MSLRRDHMRFDEGGAAWSAGAGDALVIPTPTQPMPDHVEAILGWQSFVSPTYCINWAISEVCGIDPFSWLTGWAAGDWEGFSVAGDALVKLSSWTQVTQTQLDGVVSSLSFDWEGSAADAAQAYFAELSAALTAVEEGFAGLAESFQTTATGIWLAGEAAVAGLAELCDWLLLLALEVAAGVAMSWTGVGAVAAGLAATATALKAASVWRTILTYHGRAVAIAEGFSGLLTANLALVHGLEGVRFPEATLEVPVVGTGR